MHIGPVAEVGEHVLHLGERRQADEGRALPAHMGEGAGLVAIVLRHEVAADAGTRKTAVGEFGRRRVRAAGAESGDAPQQPVGPLHRLGQRQRRHIQAEAAEERAEAAGDRFRGQLHQRRQQFFAVRQGFAADCRTLIGWPVVERVAYLGFDEVALFLDHQDGALAAGEFAETFGFQRPGHRDLVQRQLRMVVQAEAFERMQRVVVRLANGDQPDGGVRCAKNQLVQLVRARPGLHRRQALIHQTAFEFRAFGGEAHGVVEVQPVRRQRDVGRDKGAARMDDGSGGLLHGLGRGFHRDPEAAEAGQRPAGQTEVDHVLHRTRIEHGHTNVLENVFCLMRVGGRMRAVIVAGQRQHTAVFVRAGHIGTVEGVPRPVHARPLTVPHAVDAIDPLAGECVHLLRAHEHGRGEVLVHPRLEPDVIGFHQLFVQPQLPVEHAERGAAIAGNQCGGVEAGGLVEHPLLQQQTQQRLDAGQQHRPVIIAEPRFQCGCPETDATVHFRNPLSPPPHHIVGLSGWERLA